MTEFVTYSGKEYLVFNCTCNLGTICPGQQFGLVGLARFMRWQPLAWLHLCMKSYEVKLKAASAYIWLDPRGRTAGLGKSSPSCMYNWTPGIPFQSTLQILYPCLNFVELVSADETPITRNLANHLRRLLRPLEWELPTPRSKMTQQKALQHRLKFIRCCGDMWRSLPRLIPNWALRKYLFVV